LTGKKVKRGGKKHGVALALTKGNLLIPQLGEKWRPVVTKKGDQKEYLRNRSTARTPPDSQGKEKKHVSLAAWRLGGYVRGETNDPGKGPSGIKKRKIEP